MISSYVDLARIFSRMLREDLTADQMAEINARNASESHAGDVCATHDFIDANQIMIDALAEIQIDFDSQDSGIASMIDHAWTLAKAYQFDAARIPDNADEPQMWANGSPIVNA